MLIQNFQHILPIKYAGINTQALITGLPIMNENTEVKLFFKHCEILEV